MAKPELEDYVAERKQLEAALRQPEETMTRLYKSLPVPTYTWRVVGEDGLDHKGNVEYVIPFYLELSEYQREEVIGKHWFTHFLPKQYRQEVGEAFIDSRRNFTPNTRIRFLPSLVKKKRLRGLIRAYGTRREISSAL